VFTANPIARSLEADMPVRIGLLKETGFVFAIAGLLMDCIDARAFGPLVLTWEGNILLFRFVVVDGRSIMFDGDTKFAIKISQDNL
jgi:hypothetical protein